MLPFPQYTEDREIERLKIHARTNSWYSSSWDPTLRI